MDTSNLNISNQDIMNSSVKSRDNSDENIFVFDSSEQSVNSLRNKSNNKSTLSDSGPTAEDDKSEDVVSNLDWRGKAIKESPVWCMDFCNDLIILGCADGRLEFWEASTGKLMVCLLSFCFLFLLVFSPIGFVVSSECDSDSTVCYYFI